jgi:transposase
VIAIIPECCARSSRNPQDRITAESFEPGTTISAVARRNGVSLGLLHYWRRVARKGGQVEELRFVPVAMAKPVSADPAGTIEIVVDDVRIRVDGHVDIDRLRVIIAAVRR